MSYGQNGSITKKKAHNLPLDTCILHNRDKRPQGNAHTCKNTPIVDDHDDDKEEVGRGLGGGRQQQQQHQQQHQRYNKKLRSVRRESLWFLLLCYFVPISVMFFLFDLFSNKEIGQVQLRNVQAELQMEQSSFPKGKKSLEIEGHPIEGLSVGGHETCVIFPSINAVFDVGRCLQRAISQDYIFVSHGHLDHIGALPMHVAMRGLYKMKPPTIFLPTSIKEDVEKLFEVYRGLDKSEMKHNLVGLDVGEEFPLENDLKVKAFRTYHVVASQGYVIYSTRHKLNEEYAGLSGNAIKNLRLSGVEVTHSVSTPEIAFTGDTSSDFIIDPDNIDVLKARILVMESTYIDAAMSIDDARDHGHTHLTEIVSYAEKFENKAILLIHFSARYVLDDIEAAVTKLPPPLSGRVFALTEGF